MTFSTYRLVPTSTHARVFVMCAVGLLSACGGGGDDGPTQSAIDFPIASAYSAYSQTSHQYNLAGSLDGTNFTMNYSFTPSGAGTFEGKPASTALQTIILKANGVLASQTTEKTYFALNPFVSYGGINQDDGSYTVFNQVANLPTTARVGQSGAIGNSTEYADSSKTQVIGTTTVTWTLEADTATTAFFCSNGQFSGSVSGTGSECYRVDSNGNVLGLIVKTTVNGKTLTLD